jgi:hypothetical protein
VWYQSRLAVPQRPVAVCRQVWGVDGVDGAVFGVSGRRPVGLQEVEGGGAGPDQGGPQRCAARIWASVSRCVAQAIACSAIVI